MNKNQIIIYKTEDGKTSVDVKINNDNVWLTQSQMQELLVKPSRT